MEINGKTYYYCSICETPYYVDEIHNRFICFRGHRFICGVCALTIKQWINKEVV